MRAVVATRGENAEANAQQQATANNDAANENNGKASQPTHVIQMPNKPPPALVPTQPQMPVPMPAPMIIDQVRMMPAILCRHLTDRLKIARWAYAFAMFWCFSETTASVDTPNGTSATAATPTNITAAHKSARTVWRSGCHGPQQKSSHSNHVSDGRTTGVALVDRHRRHCVIDRFTLDCRLPALPNGEPRVLEIQVPAIALQENRLHNVLTQTNIIQSVMSLPPTGTRSSPLRCIPRNAKHSEYSVCWFFVGLFSCANDTTAAH